MRRYLQRLAVAGLIAVSATAPAQAPRVAALDLVAPGAWSLHEIGSTGAPLALCVREATALLQVRHGASQCSRFVVDQGPRRATVHYTCPGLGYGRTTLSVEDEGVIRLQTQGILRGAPFDFDYEARRTGTCSPAGTR
ncbi:hypothetical protein M0208_15505 [Sphingomonas sp. SUN019]|uniref:DUF3617 domain-containing protein n=1 Tax=Sphingomonas sp. SUN019 TaxID=2937788 RepID=UPI0021643ADD|nr:hypothetical protein [Sphingomonas sp. SUN019]UVO51848.1 hypothetical protein M0208_15505 [Sphingomonas sp. SUN019]